MKYRKREITELQGQFVQKSPLNKATREVPRQEQISRNRRGYGTNPPGAEQTPPGVPFKESVYDRSGGRSFRSVRQFRKRTPDMLSLPSTAGGVEAVLAEYWQQWGHLIYPCTGTLTTPAIKLYLFARTAPCDSGTLDVRHQWSPLRWYRPNHAMLAGMWSPTTQTSNWKPASYICRHCLEAYVRTYVRTVQHAGGTVW